MKSSRSEIATTTISVFTRHSLDCPKRDDPQWRRCRCRKSIYIYEHGRKSVISAKTRSWEQAEKVAQAERDKRDPVKIELARIEAVPMATSTLLDVALDRWIASMKGQSKATQSSYRSVSKALLRWAWSKEILYVDDITANLLDEWIGQWNVAAAEKENCLSPASQGFRLSRLRAFFHWAHALKIIQEDPTVPLRSIKRERLEETMPLSPDQFQQLIEATYAYDTDRRANKDRFGADLRAVFLLQRWTGLRLADALMLPRSGVKGNRITTTTQKTGAEVDIIVPDAVITALEAVPRRPHVHQDQFFWSRRCDHRTLSGMWTPRIRLLNRHLDFYHPKKGTPMPFRSHMLRDTFAVELLLAGVSLEKVSKLLTHESVRVTEDHYRPWVPRLQKQLEDEVVAAVRKMGATVTL